MPVAAAICSKPDWTRRFACRAMLVSPNLDSVSAVMVAEAQFDEACDLEPEQAAEIYSLPQ